MIVRTTKQKIRRAALAVGALALFIPVSVSQSDAVTTTEACADSSCCREFNSWCVDIADAYSANNGCYPISP